MKTAAFGRKFLGYSLWVGKGREVKCKVADKAMQTFKSSIRQMTCRSGGRSMKQVVEKLRLYRLFDDNYLGRLEGLFRIGTNSQRLAKAGRMAAPSIAGHPTQALVEADNHLPRA